MKKIQIKFYPNVSRMSKRTGKTPLYMRITKGGKKAESKPLFELDQNQNKLWNKELERLNLKGATLNMHLDRIETRFNQLIAIDFERIYTLSVKELRNELLGKDKQEVLLFKDFLRDYMRREVHESTLLKEATKNNYDKAAKHMYSFLERRPPTKVNEVDFGFANDFKNYLMSEKPDGRKGMTEVSACGIIKKFRKIMNHAIHLELHSKNPFKQIKLSYDSPEKENFPLNELPKLFQTSGLNHIEKKHLMIPFQQRWYYMPEMQGSYSIKKVLPALMPSLSYKNLNIQEGGTASNTFTRILQGNFEGDIEQTRKDLLAYCELDTLAMVKILEVLRDV